jgi:hypothetical protein
VSIFGHSYFGGGGFYMRSAGSYGNFASKLKKRGLQLPKFYQKTKKDLKNMAHQKIKRTEIRLHSELLGNKKH